jgi:hypothetical protein
LKYIFYIFLVMIGMCNTISHRLQDKHSDSCEEVAIVVESRLPKFDYYLDESDPDIATLHRQDGAFVGAFSARGYSKEGVSEAAKEDYAALLEEHMSWEDAATELERSAWP